MLRFECDEFGKISPLEFIPLLEESDLIIPVGRWVLDQALKAVSMFSNIKVQINMSYVQVLKTPALNDILNIIKNYKIENNQLVIELTESGFIESNKNFIDFCNGLKKENILLALDDFGTGYSNFHYLYYLKTTRHDIILPDGVLSLDENEYNHHHDYEIEFEVEDYDQGLQAFKKIIQPYHLEYKQNCLSKIKRMLETLKNE